MKEKEKIKERVQELILTLKLVDLRLYWKKKMTTGNLGLLSEVLEKWHDCKFFYLSAFYVLTFDGRDLR